MTGTPEAALNLAGRDDAAPRVRAVPGRAFYRSPAGIETLNFPEGVGRDLKRVERIGNALNCTNTVGPVGLEPTTRG